jgi:hypothetical protein
MGPRGAHGGRPRHLAARLLLGAALLFVPARGPASADAALDAGIERADAAVARAKSAPKADKGLQAFLKAEMAALDPVTTTVRSWMDVLVNANKPADERHAYASAWNDLLTLTHLHGVSPGKAKHFLRERKVEDQLMYQYPVSTRWTAEYPNEDQKKLVLTQKGFGGAVLRTLMVHVYRWNTVYSGVGGENCQKLAEVLWKLDKEIYANRARDASRGVEVKRLNAKIPRSYYYFARGVDPVKETLTKVQNWYFKGWATTFAIELVENLDEKVVKVDPDKWLQAEGDPEIAAVLDSFALMGK